jgi:hypothetical protein
MQMHTLKWQADTDAHPAGEIVTAVEARAFKVEADAKRFWERVNAATERTDLSVMRMSSLTRDPHVVVVLGDPEQLKSLLNRIPSPGTPHELAPAVLEALVLRRMRVLLSAGSAGKAVNTVIRRGPKRADGLRPDGTVSALKRTQG